MRYQDIELKLGSQAPRLIYGLTDPRTGEIRYIARSYFGIEHAFRHARAAVLKEDYSAKGAWIRQLKSRQLSYGVVVLAEVDSPDDVLAAELFCVALFRYLGAPLLVGVDTYEPKVAYDPLIELNQYDLAKIDAAFLSGRDAE